MNFREKKFKIYNSRSFINKKDHDDLELLCIHVLDASRQDIPNTSSGSSRKVASFNATPARIS